MKKEKIFLGADHAGFEAKEKIKKYFESNNIDYEDLGYLTYDSKDDYPDIAFKVAKKVAKDKKSKGILLCGTGEGMAIAADKVKGIRAVEAYDLLSAKLSREHNDSNVLALGARTLSIEKIKKIITAWLNTEFSKAKRHERRIKEITHFENSQKA